ncbi:hypothetical protein CcCBS67573_g00724 [Chytriomyces confervae]|uniref:Extracellular metalloproteinase n=1 Tax=Chytriomyces confervae TaxID=246404 RepID=A0A507FNY8_9FUNG|nr:hypothetical protein CcCBS67573_g00724 [Chytriomyces confervae]
MPAYSFWDREKGSRILFFEMTSWDSLALCGLVSNCIGSTISAIELDHSEGHMRCHVVVWRHFGVGRFVDAGAALLVGTWVLDASLAARPTPPTSSSRERKSKRSGSKRVTRHKKLTACKFWTRREKPFQHNTTSSLSMHAPAFFAALLTLCAVQLNAAPLVVRDAAAVPPYVQPEAVPIALNFSLSGLVGRDGANIDTVSAAAADALAKSFNLSKDEIKVSHAHTSTNSGVHHVHFVQVVDGIEVSNAVANVNINPDGSVLSVYSSFITVPTTSFVASDRTSGISADAAVLQYAKAKGLTSKNQLTVTQDGSAYTVKGASFVIQDIKASKKMYQKGSDLVAVWDLSVDLGDKWQNAFVSIKTGELVAVSDWTSDFSDANYLAVPQNEQAPVGSRLAQLTNPWNLKASPNGWHVIKGQERKDLYGNNVAAASNPNGGASQTNSQVLALSRPSSNSLTFNYQLNDGIDAMNPTNINAAITNMFVATNTAHDLFYNYGFTEAAANFQFDNMGKGGLENDGVIATCQDRFNTDPQSRNNANFATPPDGQNGRMRMYVFDLTNPGRDGAFDNSVIYHEFGHGLSNRLTGGGSNPNCLANTISGGMGEGWSDVWAVVMTLPNSATRATNVEMGKYVLGGSKGIRRYPYSTSLTTNPLKFSKLATLNEVHDIGEVWCSALYEVFWNMVDVSGWVNPADLVTSQASGAGNADFVSIVVQGMKLQPCSPSFLQARDAILQADQALYRGKYACAIWKGFAKRGMGVNARTGGAYTDNGDIPAACSNPPPTSSATVATTSKVIVTSTVPTSAVTTSKPPVSSTVSSVPPKSTTTQAGGNTVANGGTCTTFGQWACSYQCICNYVANNALQWQCNPTSVTCSL